MFVWTEARGDTVIITNSTLDLFKRPCKGHERTLLGNVPTLWGKRSKKPPPLITICIQAVLRHALHIKCLPLELQEHIWSYQAMFERTRTKYISIPLEGYVVLRNSHNTFGVSWSKDFDVHYVCTDKSIGKDGMFMYVPTDELDRRLGRILTSYCPGMGTSSKRVGEYTLIRGCCKRLKYKI